MTVTLEPQRQRMSTPAASARTALAPTATGDKPPPSGRLLTAREWSTLRLVWLIIASSFVATQAYAPAGGLWFGLCTFWAMARRPELIPALLLAGVPLVTNVLPAGVNMSIVEVGLLLTGTASIASAATRLGPLFLPVVLYLLVCLLSSALDFRGSDAISSWVQTVVYLVLSVSVFGHYVKDERQVLVACLALMGVSLVLSGALVLIGSGGYVFGIHKNSIGGTTSAATVCAMAVWLHLKQTRSTGRVTLVLLVLSAGLFFTLSRGSWLAAIVGGVMLAAMYRQWRIVIVFAVLALPVAAIAYQFLPESQQTYVMSSFDPESHSFETRAESKDLAWEFFWLHPLLGSGLGLRKQYDATNILLFTLAETGVLGLLTFGLVHMQAATTLFKARRVAQPGSLTLMAAGLGVALLFGRLAHGMFDHYWSRGAITATWAMVGAALALSLRRRREAARDRAERLAAVEERAKLEMRSRRR